MLENYIKIAIRNIIRNKIYSFINLCGLALGIACCIIIASYIRDEVSYDDFHKKGDQIYRVNLFGKIADNEFNVANSPAPLAGALREEFPEVINTVRIMKAQDIFIKDNNSLINEKNFFYADSTIFNVFTINIIEGDSNSALALPNSVVITPGIAKKYFGSENPVGKIIETDDNTNFIVTGIVEPLPTNSHFHFDFIASLQSIENQLEEFWISNSVHTYVLLEESADAKDFENKLHKMVESRVGPQIQAVMGVTFNEFENSGNSFRFYVKPLKDIHLYSDTHANIEPPGSLESIYIFGAIALIIILLACINFINLSTAHSSRRANEVGIRKVLGSIRSKLIKQFISETIFLTFLSLIIAFGFIEILLPIFNSIIGKEIQVNYLTDFRTAAIIIIGTILIGILAGSYPAFLLSSFKPVSILKGHSIGGKQSNKLRSIVVIFQFAITIILLASTFIVFYQLEYVQNKNLGYNAEQIIILPMISELGDKKEEFKATLLNNSNILKGTLTFSLPNRRNSATIFQKPGSEENQNFAFVYNFVDYDFLETYQIELLSGRNFSSEYSTDTSSIIINETAVKELGLENPLGSYLLAPHEGGEESSQINIIGVVKDFHFENLREKIRPMVLTLGAENESLRFLSLKINNYNISETVSFIQHEWEKFIPGKPFEYQFMDDDFNVYYKEEQRTGKLFSSFTALAIFIACLGLLGLISHTVEQRKKELGIRKVLGASMSTILVLLSKEFIKWLIIANIIAIPIVYYFMNKWLQNFVYRDEISFTVFLTTGFLSFVIAVVTVAFHTIKAALENPVKSLRNE